MIFNFFFFFRTDVTEFTMGQKRRVELSWTAIMQQVLCDSINQQGHGLCAGEGLASLSFRHGSRI